MNNSFQTFFCLQIFWLAGGLKPEYGAGGTLATGEIIDGSTRIHVYGDPDSNKPSSWIVGKMGESDQIDPATGWKYYKFRPVTENEANNLPITNKAIIMLGQFDDADEFFKLIVSLDSRFKDHISTLKKDLSKRRNN